jgi:hypothetical protein
MERLARARAIRDSTVTWSESEVRPIAPSRVKNRREPSAKSSFSKPCATRRASRWRERHAAKAPVSRRYFGRRWRPSVADSGEAKQQLVHAGCRREGRSPQIPKENLENRRLILIQSSRQKRTSLLQYGNYRDRNPLERGKGSDECQRKQQLGRRPHGAESRSGASVRWITCRDPHMFI